MKINLQINLLKKLSEALDHIQDILKDDGLTLSKDVKANLEKAASILSDKGLKEGWFSKPLPKESVVFEVYLPFKKEPAQFQIPPVSSLDDPLVTDTIQKIRKRHPHSTIYLRSKLGNKTITEEKGKKTPEVKDVTPVVKVIDNIPTILRPGFITKEDIENVVGFDGCHPADRQQRIRV